MKMLIASDIHGDFDSAKNIIDIYDREKCDKLLILGDILYHGPRNNLPVTYSPKEVTELLNERRDIILAVRGNCDAEVDQMVLNFPILASYAYISADGLSIFATHGHKFNMQTPPPLRKGEILLHGHTHVLKCVEFGQGNFYINPGSVAMPKEGNPRTYMIYESRTFTTYDLEGKKINEIVF